MKPFSEAPVRPDMPDTSDLPETTADCPRESEDWQESIELPEDSDGWVDSIELPEDSEEWRDSIDLTSSATHDGVKTEANEPQNETDDSEEKNLENLLADYFDDLFEKSEFPETLTGQEFEVDDLEKLSPEETAKMREEFDDLKPELKKQWEEENGMPWPKYENDVYSSNGKLIRKAGSDYDAHHIQPLSLGGKNEAKNITPLHAEVHYDKQGIHAPDSPYSQIDKALGGK